MRLDYETDAGLGARAALGLIVLAADETLEAESARLTRVPGVALYHSRIPMAPVVSPETLTCMAADLPAAAGLLPGPAACGVIGYGCTSAAAVIGSENVARAIRTTCPDARVTDPLAALIAAGRHLGVRRLGFLSPYAAKVSLRLRERLAEAGFEIAAFGSFEAEDDRVVGRITPESIAAGVQHVAEAAPCDALVISCTSLRCLDVIPQIEAQTGLPVLTSNQALAWHMLRLAGIEDRRPEFGRLFA